MSVFDIGVMFWGKAQSYPWWPAVIITDAEGVWKRRNKKIGIQYHVQFIGDEYDPSWISQEFLVEFHGKDRFEQYVIDQLNSSLPAPDKLKFDMRMSQSIKESWTQACDSSELLYSMDINSRLAQLPKSTESQIVNKSTKKRNFPKKGNFDADFKSESLIKKARTKKSSIIVTSTISENEDKTNAVLDAKESKKNRKKTKRRYSDFSNHEDQYPLDSNKSDINISEDIEKHCFRAFLLPEKLNLLSDNNIPVEQSILEKTLNDRWSTLDIKTKLLYVNDEVNIIGTSQSKVSGRKIRIPSKLRSTEDVSRIIKSKVTHDSFSKNGDNTTNYSTSVLSIKTENINNPEISSSASSPNVIHQNTTVHEIIDESLWKGLTSENCLTNIMKIVIQGSIPEVPNTCYYCFIPLLPSDNLLICNGECHASYHAECATVNKIMRSVGSHLCVYCDQKQDVCCICRNSKYMNKNFLVKCQKKNCSLNFHVNCAKVLTFAEITENEMVTCPNHSCLTCTKEDIYHQCNTEGNLVSCIKCQLSYHDNLICIPAGCRILSKDRIICYRHYDNKLERMATEQFLRCFHCFEENATLKCCRCRAIFHPKCLGLATYSDLLKEYICTTCKLDQPMFYGQITWILRNDMWIPAEIIDYLQFVDDISKRTQQSLLLNNLENDTCYFANRHELIPFVSGLSILKDVINISNTVLQLAKLRNVLYWNWRSRLRPVMSQKFPFLDQIHLLKHSLKDSNLPETNVDTYRHVNKNIYPKKIKKFLPSSISDICCITSLTETCSTKTCINFVNHVECTDSNCSNILCNNRLFATAKTIDSCIIQSSISGQGVQVNNCVEENEFLGECTGTILTVESVLKQMYEREHLTSVSYMFKLTEDIFLDCEKIGNEWRHLNHSCNPNAKISFNVSGFVRLAVLSLRPISKEEITIDYMANGLVLKYGFVCQCNSINCSKIIGPSSVFLNTETLITPRCCINSVKKSEDFSETISNLPLKSLLNVTVTDENFPDKVTCYKCGNHGEVIMCDKSNCEKRYHLSCVNTSYKPRGLWFCPVHFCYFCGQSSTKICSNCPISCCSNDLSLHENHRCSQATEDEYSNHSAENTNCYMEPLETDVLKKENVNNSGKEMNEKEESDKSHDEDNITYETQLIISDPMETISIKDSDIIYKDFIISTVKNAESESSVPTEIKSNNDALSFQKSFLDSLSYPRESMLESIIPLDVNNNIEELGVGIINERSKERIVEDISRTNDNERNYAPRSCDFEMVRYDCLPCRIGDGEKVISPPVIDE